jgi:hypothetical protein
MLLKSARVIGFQSFSDSGEIAFGEGFNLIVGQNNTGKSAFLRALLPALTDDRHRTPERWENDRLAPPDIHLRLAVSGEELQSAIYALGEAWIPSIPSSDPLPWVRELLHRPSIDIEANHRPGYASLDGPYPGHGQFAVGTGQMMCAHIVSSAGELQYTLQYTATDSTSVLLFRLWQTKMFYFAAERMTIGESAHGHENRLSAKAENLPAVLFTLSGDQGDTFRKLVEHLREIFPSVGNLSVRPVPGNANRIEIRVWPTEAMARVELSFPLNNSGTGVAQVIALLTAIMTVDRAVIMIDEINSFLHPAAVKALLRILQTHYSQHQYIISTHAPEVISFSNPTTLHLIKRSGYESKIEKLDLSEVDQFREIAEHLGVAMSDVFAADRIVWVEGPTEELCFPLLYRQATGHALPRGTIFTSVAATGDFMAKRRDRALVYEIYERLGSSATPLVVSVAFSFDSEKLSADEKQGMIRESRGKIHFLPRRHLECYLLDPEAIAAFITARDPLSDSITNADDVASTLRALAQSAEFEIQEWNGDLGDQAWQTNVDAAKLIAKTCSDLSEQRATFNKKSDTLFLLQHIQTNRPALVAPLADYVRRLVDGPIE